MNPLVLKPLTRRSSLLTLGTAGLTAAFASPFATGAKKKHGKNGGKKEDVNALCKKQVGPCVTSFSTVCGGDLTCLATVNLCCQSLESCDFDGFLICVTAPRA